jgi:Tfp pilus assembly protein PilF
MNISAQTLRNALLSAMVFCMAASTIVRNAAYRTPTMLWENGVQRSPEKRRPLFNFGQALSREGRYAEALDRFTASLGLPDDGIVQRSDVYREVGVAYLNLGLYEEADMVWRKALDLAPADARLMNSLAVVRVQQGRLDDAELLAERAASADAHRPEPLTVLADIAMRRGRFGEAIPFLERYLRVRPEDARVSWSMALALREAGRYGEALTYAQRFQALERDPRYRRIADELVQQLLNRAVPAGK